MDRSNKFNIGTLNIRGCITNEQQNLATIDAGNYNIDILALTETHIKEETLIKNFNVVAADQQKVEYIFFSSNLDNNSFGGIGFIIKKELNPTFKVRNNRICTANIKLKNNRKLVIICAYAPTLNKCNKYPELKEDFYNALQTAVNNTANRDTLIIAGDLNAITGTGHSEFPEVIGKYGKGKLNASGRTLLEFCSLNNLVLTNTFFQHKLAHISTWTAPNNINRKNPVRNQIDYIITRKNIQPYISNSRSYNGINSDSDHKLVKMTINLKWHKIYNNQTLKTNSHQINVENFYYEKYQTEYYNALTQHTYAENKSTQENWSNIVNVCLENGVTILGKKSSKNQTDNKELAILTQQNHKIRKDIESSRNKDEIETMKTQRKEIKKQINIKLTEIKEDQLENDLKGLENMKNDSN